MQRQEELKASRKMRVEREKRTPANSRKHVTAAGAKAETSLPVQKHRKSQTSSSLGTSMASEYIEEKSTLYSHSGCWIVEIRRDSVDRSDLQRENAIKGLSDLFQLHPCYLSALSTDSECDN